MALAPENEEMTVVLMGKTGAGKSSLGNSLMGGKKSFKVGKGLKSETQRCSFGQNQYEELSLVLQVVDTPGLCDTCGSDENIYKEIAKTVALAEDGPHVIIFTLRCDRRFTAEEYQAYQKILDLFSYEMNNFLIVVFNGLDSLMDDDEDEDEDEELSDAEKMEKLEEARECLDEEITKFGPTLQELVDNARGGYFGMNNKMSRRIVDQQVMELIQKMKELKEENGNERYSTEKTKNITKQMMKMVKKYVKEHPGVTEAEAIFRIKHDIVEETVEPSFFNKIRDIVAEGAVKITEKCVVM